LMVIFTTSWACRLVGYFKHCNPFRIAVLEVNVPMCRCANVPIEEQIG